MTHYVCEGDCHGVSENPGVCQTEGCLNYQKPLSECHCEDGKHEIPAMETEEENQSIEI